MSRMQSSLEKATQRLAALEAAEHADEALYVRAEGVEELPETAWITLVDGNRKHVSSRLRLDVGALRDALAVLAALA